MTLFRESSNSSEVVLSCRSKSEYRRAKWTRTSSSQPTPVVLTSSSRVSFDVFQRDRFSSPAFSGVDYPMHISPLKIEDGGEYRCIFDRPSFSSPEGVLSSERVLVKLNTIQGKSMYTTVLSLHMITNNMKSTDFIYLYICCSVYSCHFAYIFILLFISKNEMES